MFLLLTTDVYISCKNSVGLEVLAQAVEHGTLDLRVVGSSPTLGMELTLKKKKKGQRVLIQGLHRKCRTGAPGWLSRAPNFGSGHDLTVCKFEPRIRLCADRSEPGARFGFRVSLSLQPSPVYALSLSQK